MKHLCYNGLLELYGWNIVEEGLIDIVPFNSVCCFHSRLLEFLPRLLVWDLALISARNCGRG